MKPGFWFGAAAALFGFAVACVEVGVKAYVNDDRWDKALNALHPDEDLKTPEHLLHPGE